MESETAIALTKQRQRQRRPHLKSPHPGERVVLLRNRLGVSQHELAKTASVHVETIRRLERGVDVRRESLEAVAAALDTTISYLYTPIE